MLDAWKVAHHLALITTTPPPTTTTGDSHTHKDTFTDTTHVRTQSSIFILFFSEMRTQEFETNLILPREEVASQNANPVEFSGSTHSFTLGVGNGTRYQEACQCGSEIRAVTK